MKKMILLAVLIGSVSMARASGSHEAGHHMEDKHWSAPKYAANEINPIPVDSKSKSEGKKLFSELCARCHGAEALGDGPDSSTLAVKPTNLRAMAGVHSDGDFAWKINHGRGEMPAWEDELEDQEVWHLVNYIQSLKAHSPAHSATHKHEHD